MVSNQSFFCSVNFLSGLGSSCFWRVIFVGHEFDLYSMSAVSSVQLNPCMSNQGATGAQTVASENECMRCWSRFITLTAEVRGIKHGRIKNACYKMYL